MTATGGTQPDHTRMTHSPVGFGVEAAGGTGGISNPEPGRSATRTSRSP
ncbi:hypothetical protein ACWKSP_11915 [Micromonosporaceae bacterium Da 78-11]